MPNDLTQVRAEGFFLNPPDTRGNMQRIFVPRSALSELTVLAVIGSAAKRRRQAEASGADTPVVYGHSRRVSAIAGRWRNSNDETFSRKLLWRLRCCSCTLMPNMKLFDIAQILGASLENASPETEVTGVAGIENAGPQQITFISNPKYAALAKSTQAAAILVTPDFPAEGRPVLRHANPTWRLRAPWSFFISPQGTSPVSILRR